MDSEGGDRVTELRDPPKSRRKDQRSSDESNASHHSGSSKDLGYVSGDGGANLIGYSQPSAEEATYYFWGLAGNPKIIARTSKTPYVRAFSGTYPRKKWVTNIGNHPLRAVYNLEVRKSIWNALKSIPWVTIDIARIGYSGKQSVDPVVMLITIKPDSTPWVKAQEAVITCQKIIQQ
jgi:hypothetical protein